MYTTQNEIYRKSSRVRSGKIEKGSSKEKYTSEQKNFAMNISCKRRSNLLWNGRTLFYYFFVLSVF